MSVKFKNPPINELVIGVYFDGEVPSLRSEHIGLFWGEVKKTSVASNSNRHLDRQECLRFSLKSK
jgi:hypothetical protein